MSAEMTVEGMISVFMKIRKVYADEFGRMLGNETYSPNEISILLFLANNPSIDTNSQLCTCLGVSKALVCRSVDALLGKEMIISVADDHDKRVQHLKLMYDDDMFGYCDFSDFVCRQCKCVIGLAGDSSK